MVSESSVESGGTRATVHLHGLLRCAEDLGISSQGLLQRAGFAPDLEGGFLERVPAARWYAFWELLLDSGFSPLTPFIHPNQRQHFSANVVRYLCQTAPSIEGALALLLEFWELFSDDFALELHLGMHEGLLCVSRPLRSRGERAELLFTFTSVLLWLIEPHLQGAPGAVRLEWCGELPAAFRELFPHVAVSTQAPRDAISMPRALLLQPLPNSDEGMATFFRQEAINLLATLRGHTSVSIQILQLLEELPSDSWTLEAIAERLQISRRTLQRNLMERDQSFRALLDTFRAERARTLVWEMEDDALASALGYAEVRSFRRAFHRWTGMTTRQFRRRTAFNP